MKRLVFVAGVLSFLLMGQAGFAKTLEEVLKEKGVITEAHPRISRSRSPAPFRTISWGIP